MKHRFLCLLALSLSYHAFAQNGTGQISGEVRDLQNKPLGGTTVVLNYESDTTIQTNRVADANGAFAFTRLPKGYYRVTCTHIGFGPYKLSHLLIDDTHQNIGLPAIILQPSGNHVLNDVIITAKKPLIGQKIDRTVVNVDAMISVAGSNILDALSKSPGVIVDANDNISLNGKAGVLVLIDDRPTYLSGQDLAAYLRSLPAGTVDKLELISNPPARYDASGGAVINIVLKKNRSAGFNGGINIGYNQGVYGRSNDALNINYRASKFNLFSNLSYSLDQNFSKETFDRYFYNPDGSLNSATLQNSYYKYAANGWNGRLGIDYFVTPNTTLGLMLTRNTRPRTDMLNYTTSQYGSAMQLDSTGRGYNNGRYQAQNAGINLNMLHKFDQQGTQLTADLDYLHFYNNGDQYAFSNQPYQFLLPSSINIYSGKMIIRTLSGEKASLMPVLSQVR